MSRRVIIEGDLRHVSDHALVRGFDAVLRERGLPPLVIGDGAEGLKAAGKHQHEEEFAERYIATAVHAFIGEFSGFIDRIIARINAMFADGSLRMPLDLEAGHADTLRSVLDEQVANFLEEIGFADPTVARAVGDKVRTRAPWLPDLIVQGFRMGMVSHRIPENTEWATARDVAQQRPITAVTRHAIQYAREKAGAYLRPVAYRVRDDVLRRMLSIDMQITRRRVLVGLRARIKPERLAGHLADLTGYKADRGDGKLIWQGGSWMRDWRRVARTEMADASAHGHLMAHLEEHPINAGADPDQGLQIPRQLVFKIPQAVRRDGGKLVAPCKHCHRIWYYNDETPRLYPMDEVVGNGSNAGPPPKKANQWLATVGPTHPNDLCGRLNIYVPGSESLFPGFKEQLAKFAGQGFEGVD